MDFRHKVLSSKYYVDLGTRYSVSICEIFDFV